MNKEDILINILPGLEDKYCNSRVKFTEFNMSGLHDFHEYSTHSDFFKYLEFGRQNQLSDAVEYINKIQNRILHGHHGGHTMYWFIRLRETKKVIGSMALMGVDFDNGLATLTIDGQMQITVGDVLRVLDKNEAMVQPGSLNNEEAGDDSQENEEEID